jgi:hypothetical protein
VRGWRGSLAVNALGAAVTAVVLIVFVLTRFVHGAWVVVVVLPTLVLLFAALGRHYRRFNAQLSLIGAPLSEAAPANMVLIPVPFVHKGVVQALAYSRCLRCDVRAGYVETEPERTEQVLKDWASLGTAVPLDVAPSPYRVYVGVLLDYIDRARAERRGGVVTRRTPCLARSDPKQVGTPSDELRPPARSSRSVERLDPPSIRQSWIAHQILTAESGGRDTIPRGDAVGPGS